MSTTIGRGLRILLAVLPAVLAGCAQTSAMPAGEDTIRITVHVATVCAAAHAERLARRHAAVETVRRGFDAYVVTGSAGGDHEALGAPATARTTLFGRRAGPLFSERAPLLAHHRMLTVRMFRAGEGDGAGAVSARAVLGDKWEAVAAKGAPGTCLGFGG